MSLWRTLAPAIAALAIAGCSTPQVALDHANNGVALTTGLQRELTAFEARQAAIDTLRKRVITMETLLAKGYTGDNAVSDQLASLSGESEKLSIHRQLREVADLRATVAANALLDEQQIQQTLNALMKPVPNLHGKLGGTQKALADLGTELSAAERLKLVTAFLKEVRAEIDKNKQAAEQASSSN